MNELDVAWAAGLFEGEGCFFQHRPDNRGTQRVMVGATLATSDEDVIRRFADVVGVGTVRGPIPDKRSGRKPMYHWRVQSAPATSQVIELLMPFLGERRAAKGREVLLAADEISIPPQERTHCPSGHEYTDENTIITKGQHGLYRRCRICSNGYKRQWERRRRQERMSA